VEGSRLSCLPALNPSHFYRQAHSAIFTAMRSLEEDDMPIDMPILAKRLESRGALESIGGRAYLCKLTEVYGLKASNVEHYAQQLLDLARARDSVQQ
jgi:replicative DNA helicase